MPVFVASGILNLILIIVMVMLAVKNRQLGQKEYYRRFIVIFITLAYIVRLVEYVYLLVANADETYNRSLRT